MGSEWQKHSTVEEEFENTLHYKEIMFSLYQIF